MSLATFTQRFERVLENVLAAATVLAGVALAAGTALVA
jgi:hypothetical protein